MKRQKTSTSRFTLIELLVVIAIIAILASMLLPAVGAVRESSRTSVCIGIEKQLASITIQYMDDYQSFPMYWTNWYQGVSAPALNPWGGTGVGVYDRDYQMQPLRSRTGGVSYAGGVYYYGIFCPTNKAAQRCTGYAINARMTGHTNAGFGWKPWSAGVARNPMAARYPSYACIFDEYDNAGWDDGGSFTTVGMGRFWNHGKGMPGLDNNLHYMGSMNMAFLDGHVSTIPFKTAVAHWSGWAVNDWDYAVATPPEW